MWWRSLKLLLLLLGRGDGMVVVRWGLWSSGRGVVRSKGGRGRGRGSVRCRSQGGYWGSGWGLMLLLLLPLGLGLVLGRGLLGKRAGSEPGWRGDMVVVLGEEGKYCGRFTIYSG